MSKFVTFTDTNQHGHKTQYSIDLEKVKAVEELHYIYLEGKTELCIHDTSMIEKYVMPYINAHAYKEEQEDQK